VNGAPNGGAGPAGDGSSETDSSAATNAQAERVRLVKAAALGFALGMLLARWAGRIATSV
jgi:hypothetical protein